MKIRKCFYKKTFFFFFLATPVTGGVDFLEYNVSMNCAKSWDTWMEVNIPLYKEEGSLDVPKHGDNTDRGASQVCCYCGIAVCLGCSKATVC